MQTRWVEDQRTAERCCMCHPPSSCMPERFRRVTTIVDLWPSYANPRPPPPPPNGEGEGEGEGRRKPTGA